MGCILHICNDWSEKKFCNWKCEFKNSFRFFMKHSLNSRLFGSMHLLQNNVVLIVPYHNSMRYGIENDRRMWMKGDWCNRNVLIRPRNDECLKGVGIQIFHEMKRHKIRWVGVLRVQIYIVVKHRNNSAQAPSGQKIRLIRMETQSPHGALMVSDFGHSLHSAGVDEVDASIGVRSGGDTSAITIGHVRWPRSVIDRWYYLQQTIKSRHFHAINTRNIRWSISTVEK